MTDRYENQASDHQGLVFPVYKNAVGDYVHVKFGQRIGVQREDGMYVEIIAENLSEPSGHTTPRPGGSEGSAPEASDGAWEVKDQRSYELGYARGRTDASTGAGTELDRAARVVIKHARAAYHNLRSALMYFDDLDRAPVDSSAAPQEFYQGQSGDWIPADDPEASSTRKDEGPGSSEPAETAPSGSSPDEPGDAPSSDCTCGEFKPLHQSGCPQFPEPDGPIELRMTEDPARPVVERWLKEGNGDIGDLLDDLEAVGWRSPLETGAAGPPDAALRECFQVFDWTYTDYSGETSTKPSPATTKALEQALRQMWDCATRPAPDDVSDDVPASAVYDMGFLSGVRRTAARERANIHQFIRNDLSEAAKRTRGRLSPERASQVAINAVERALRGAEGTT